MLGSVTGLLFATLLATGCSNDATGPASGNDGQVTIDPVQLEQAVNRGLGAMLRGDLPGFDDLPIEEVADGVSGGGGGGTGGFGSGAGTSGGFDSGADTGADFDSGADTAADFDSPVQISESIGGPVAGGLPPGFMFTSELELLSWFDLVHGEIQEAYAVRAGQTVRVSFDTMGMSSWTVLYLIADIDELLAGGEMGLGDIGTMEVSGGSFDVDIPGDIGLGLVILIALPTDCFDEGDEYCIEYFQAGFAAILGS